MKTNPKGPAFPVSTAVYHPVTMMDVPDPRMGITLRAYIATAAMSGMLGDSSEERYITSAKEIAECSVEMADMLIAELNKTTP